MRKAKVMRFVLPETPVASFNRLSSPTPTPFHVCMTDKVMIVYPSPSKIKHRLPESNNASLSSRDSYFVPCLYDWQSYNSISISIQKKISKTTDLPTETLPAPVPKQTLHSSPPYTDTTPKSSPPPPDTKKNIAITRHNAVWCPTRLVVANDASLDVKRVETRTEDGLRGSRAERHVGMLQDVECELDNIFLSL